MMKVKHLSPDLIFPPLFFPSWLLFCGAVVLPAPSSSSLLCSPLPQGRVSCTGRMMVQAVNQRGRSRRSMPGHMRR